LFGSALFGGIAAGFLGAGLFGRLFGQGLFGGMTGFASIIGLLLQVMLIVIVARLNLRLVAAAQYASACLCGGDWTQLWRSQWNVGRHRCTTDRRTSYRRQVGL
jgi:hypothetical protein